MSNIKKTSPAKKVACVSDMCTSDLDFTRVSFFPREHRLIHWKSWKQDWQKDIQKQKIEVTSENEKESNKINLFAALLLSLSSSLTISKIRKEEALGTRLQQNYCYKTSKQVIQSKLLLIVRFRIGTSYSGLSSLKMRESKSLGTEVVYLFSLGRPALIKVNYKATY